MNSDPDNLPPQPPAQSHDERAELLHVNGLRLMCRQWGQPRATPIVLLHGLRGFSGTWRPLAAALSDEARICLVDRPLAGDRPPSVSGILTVYTSPSPGDPGNSYLYAHGYWGMFGGLLYARPGDLAYLHDYDTGRQTRLRVSRVIGRVPYSDTSWLRISTTKPTLTLQTCVDYNPKGDRFLVQLS